MQADGSMLAVDGGKADAALSSTAYDPTTGCAGVDAALCVDFDNGSSNGLLTQLRDAGSVAIDDAGVSRPNAARMKIAGTGAQAYFSHAISPSTHVHMAFDVSVGSIAFSPGEAVALVYLYFADINNMSMNAVIVVNLLPDQSLSLTSPPKDTAIGTLAGGKWNHVELDVQVDKALGPHIDTWLNGGSHIRSSPSNTSFTSANTSTQVWFGFYNKSAKAASGDLHLDNVVFY